LHNKRPALRSLALCYDSCNMARVACALWSAAARLPQAGPAPLFRRPGLTLRQSRATSYDSWSKCRVACQPSPCSPCSSLCSPCCAFILS